MKDGKIEENWRQIALDVVNRILPSAGTCSACGSSGTVSIGEHLVTPVVMDPGGNIAIGGASYPQIMLSCNNCGHVRYFNYVLLTKEQSEMDLERQNGGS